jgi:hypothetical protein
MNIMHLNQPAVLSAARLAASRDTCRSMSAKALRLSLVVLFGSLVSSYGGFGAHTNILGPVPSSGILLIDYNFYATPDTMDVYYDDVDIFSSGLLSGAGKFEIPYGPGLATSIMIVVDQGFSPGTPTSWAYTPTIVPEPSSMAILGCGLLGLGFLRRKGRNGVGQ